MTTVWIPLVPMIDTSQLEHGKYRTFFKETDGSFYFNQAPNEGFIQGWVSFEGLIKDGHSLALLLYQMVLNTNQN